MYENAAFLFDLSSIYTAMSSRACTDQTSPSSNPTLGLLILLALRKKTSDWSGYFDLTSSMIAASLDPFAGVAKQ